MSYHVDGDAYLPPGMTAEEAQKILGTGPQVGPAHRLELARAVAPAVACAQRIQLCLRRFERLPGNQRPRRRRGLAARVAMGGIRTAARLSVSFARSIHRQQRRRTRPRLGPRLQGRRDGVLDLQHRRALYGVAFARRGGGSPRRQAVVGQLEGQILQQQGRQQVGESRLSQGLGRAGSSRYSQCEASQEARAGTRNPPVSAANSRADRDSRSMGARGFIIDAVRSQGSDVMTELAKCIP